jgi:FKBP-type peptidyl-prolyl cis-trans isomerase FkpA
MKKVALCLMGLLFLLSACLKKETGCPTQKAKEAPTSEQQVIADYLAANSITATKHSTGLYYQIVEQGTGDSPNNCSSVVINYTGQLPSGAQFDYGNNVAFTLGSLIEGWKTGLPLIKKGGKIKLYIPPSLAYGSSDIKDQNGAVVIPANSMLIFDISLLDFM